MRASVESADRLNSDVLNCVVVLRSADTVPDHAV